MISKERFFVNKVTVSEQFICLRSLNQIFCKILHRTFHLSRLLLFNRKHLHRDICIFDGCFPSTIFNNCYSNNSYVYTIFLSKVFLFIHKSLRKSHIFVIKMSDNEIVVDCEYVFIKPNG